MYTKLYIYSHNKTLHYVQLFVTRTRNIENAVDVQHISHWLTSSILFLVTETERSITKKGFSKIITNVYFLRPFHAEVCWQTCQCLPHVLD